MDLWMDLRMDLSVPGIEEKIMPEIPEDGNKSKESDSVNGRRTYFGSVEYSGSGNPAEEFHIASRNRRSLLLTKNIVDTDNENRINEMVVNAPLRINSLSRDKLLIGAAEDCTNSCIHQDHEHRTVTGTDTDTDIEKKSPTDENESKIAGAPIHNESVDNSKIDLLEHIITSRKSYREFSNKPLPIKSLGKLLYLANGIRKRNHLNNFPIRNVPNSGGLGSVEIYLFALNVEDLDQGIYHFDSESHELALLRSGDFKIWLKNFAILQKELLDSGALLILTCSIGRLSSKYGIRGYRLGLLDAGHVSQNIYLAATAMDLAVCATGGFIDADINKALALDGLDNCAVLAIGIGSKCRD
jgi:SagB-type dehydrogenase family enzyme